MNILFDTNIFIDVGLKRHPFYLDSFNALSIVNGIDTNGYVLASTLTDIYYICKKNLGHNKTIDLIIPLIHSVNILGIDKDTIIFAIHSNFSDFEDAVQNAAAKLNHIDLIISRNTKDFTNSKIPVQTPTDFLKQYN